MNIARLFKIWRTSSEFFNRKTLSSCLMATSVQLEKEGPMFWWKTKVYAILITMALAIFLIFCRCWNMIKLSALKNRKIWSTNICLPDTLSIRPKLEEILLKIRKAFQHQSKKSDEYWILFLFLLYFYIVVIFPCLEKNGLGVFPETQHTSSFYSIWTFLSFNSKSK